MSFDVGDKVVYPHHGAATIERRERRDAFGTDREYLVLRLAYGDLTLMVPADNTEEVGLREVINDEEVEEVFAVLHLPGTAGELDAGLQPRGYRLLARIPRLPDSVIDHIVERFGILPKILRATVDDLDEVEGVGENRARAIQEGLSRLAESSVLDRYG